MEQSTRSIKDYIVILVKGMAMGAADIVPGVSGGTIALITGIYTEFLRSLKGLTPATLLVLYKEGPIAFWQHINGNFLLALFLGILLSAKTLATVVSWCLDAYPLLIWGGFSGLIVASFYILAKQQERWALMQYLCFVIGAAVVIALALLKPTQLPGEWWMLFIGGFIAICAMILPGISGSFILLLVGLYPAVLKALADFEVVSLSSFALGCIAGLLVFSRFLSWLLDRFYTNTLSVMMGFLAGSLWVTWPWKQVMAVTVNRHGEEIPLLQKNILPHVFPGDEQFLLVVVCFGLGVALVLSTEKLSRRV